LHQSLFLGLPYVIVAIVFLRRALKEKRSPGPTPGLWILTLGTGVVFLSLAAPRLIPERFQTRAGAAEAVLDLVALALICYWGWSAWRNADK
jgi:hypothetical protein